MNMKDAFRFQNKLKDLMVEATEILQDRRNIVKVKTTHLRSKVMGDAQTRWWRKSLPVSTQAMLTKWLPSSCPSWKNGRNCVEPSIPPRADWIWIWTARWA